MTVNLHDPCTQQGISLHAMKLFGCGMLWSKVSDNIQSPNWHCVCHFNIYIYNASQGGYRFFMIALFTNLNPMHHKNGFSKCRQIYANMHPGWYGFRMFYVVFEWDSMFFFVSMI